MVIVVGILIAFQLNINSAIRKNSKDEKNALRRISTDLKSEKRLMDLYKKEFLYSKNYLNGIVYDEKRENLDSIYFHLAKMFVQYNFNPEYISLKHSGNFNLISNDILRYKIVRYYELKYPFYKEIAENHKDFYKNRIDVYFEKELPSDTTNLMNPDLIQEKLNDPEFVELIIDQIKHYNWILKGIQNKQLDELLNLLEKMKK